MNDRGNWHSVTPEDVGAIQLGPSPSNVMLTLQIGEVVEIKGEKFRVRKITKKDVILRSVRT
jgi:hypothetical protein